MSESGNVICTTNYSKPGLIPNNKNITEIFLIWWQAVVQQPVWELSTDAIMMAIMDTVKGLCGMTGGLVQHKLCESPRGSLHKVPWRAAVDGLKWTSPPLLCPLALNTWGLMWSIVIDAACFLQDGLSPVHLPVLLTGSSYSKNSQVALSLQPCLQWNALAKKQYQKIDRWHWTHRFQFRNKG
jgi:hypothetical protein